MEGVLIRQVNNYSNKQRSCSVPLLTQLERILEQDVEEINEAAAIGPSFRSESLPRFIENESTSSGKVNDDTSLVSRDKRPGQSNDKKIIESISEETHIAFELGGKNIDIINTKKENSMDKLPVEKSSENDGKTKPPRRKRSNSVPILLQLDTILELKQEDIEDLKTEDLTMTTVNKEENKELDEKAERKHSNYKSYYALVGSSSEGHEEKIQLRKTDGNFSSPDFWRRASAPVLLENEQFYFKERPSASKEDSHHVILSSSNEVKQTNIQRRESGPKLGKPLFGDALKADILREAVLSGDASVVRYLLQQGIDPNGYDQFGWPILHTAVVSGNFDCAAVLIEFGADLEFYTELVMEEYAKVKSEFIANYSTLV